MALAVLGSRVGESSSWVGFTPDLDVEVIDLTKHVVVILPRNSPHPKKVKGKPLYKLAREGIVIERTPCKVKVSIDILTYEYPFLTIKVACSKGTYIRSLAHDIGEELGCGAHLTGLKRTKSGSYLLDECLDGQLLDSLDFDITPHLRTND